MVFFSSYLTRGQLDAVFYFSVICVQAFNMQTSKKFLKNTDTIHAFITRVFWEAGRPAGQFVWLYSHMFYRNGIRVA